MAKRRDSDFSDVSSYDEMPRFADYTPAAAVDNPNPTPWTDPGGASIGDLPGDQVFEPPQIPWRPGGDGSFPPTAYPTSPETISPSLFGSTASASTTMPIGGYGPIPTNPDGSQIGSGITWAPGATAPSSSPIGYHWDPVAAMFQKDTTNATGGLTQPTGGMLTDRNFAEQFVKYWGQQPGVNPSVANDPGYWIGRFTSGAFGNDQAYAIQRMMQAEGPPEGAGAVNPGTNGFDFSSILKSLNSKPPTVTPVSLPSFTGLGGDLVKGLNQVGQTPFDTLMDSSLADLLSHGGASPYGRQIESTLNDLIASGGMRTNLVSQLTGARDAQAGAMKGQVADARAALAARGLASPRGAGQGPETTAIGRISENLAPTYAQAVNDINSHAIDVANASVISALSMATGLAQSDAATILNTVGTGTARQTAIANIALRTLEDNMQWNEFLANFGLQKDQIQEQLQQGRIAQLTPLLNLFLTMSGQSAQGFIGLNSQ